MGAKRTQADPATPAPAITRPHRGSGSPGRAGPTGAGAAPSGPGFQPARRYLPRARARASASPGRRSRPDRSGYLFLLPWFVGIAGFTVGPMLISLYLSFTRYSLLAPPQWIGLANFRELFGGDPRYMHSLEVTAIYVAVSVPAQLLVALLVALLLNRQRRGTGIYRSLFYLPSLLAGSVAIAFVWRAVFDTGGAVDGALSLFGVHPGTWIGQPGLALWTLVILAAWQFGAPMVIFLAGLKQVPQDLYDAAAVDGAGRLRRLFSVTLPMLSPVVFFNLVLGVIGAFQAFTPAYIVSGGRGGPADSTLFYTLYLYQEGFTNYRMGYASAMAWVLLVLTGAVTYLLFRTSRRWVFYAGGRFI